MSAIGAIKPDKDVDDPQGVYPQNSPLRPKSSSLALEGDEESSGQTMDNAADVSYGKKRRSVTVRPNLGNKASVMAMRHRRLVRKRRPGVSAQARVLSTFPPSSSSKTASDRPGRGTALLPKSPSPVPSQRSATRPNVRARKRRTLRKTGGRAKAISQRGRPPAPRPVAVETIRHRHRRDIGQQVPAEPSSFLSPLDRPVTVLDRQTRQADDDDDGDGDSDDDDSDSADDDDDGKNDSDDDNDDDNDDDDDDDDGGIDFSMFRKKRSSGSEANREEAVVKEEDWDQRAGISETASDRQKRQADIVTDITDADDDLDDGEDSDEDDNRDTDDEDDQDEDFVDLSLFRKKREAGTRQHHEELRQKGPQAQTEAANTLPISARAKRQDNTKDTVEGEKISYIHNGDKRDASEDDKADHEVNDVLQMGLVQTKREPLKQEKIQLSRIPQRVMRQQPNPDGLSDDDDYDDVNDALTDMMENEANAEDDMFEDTDDGQSALQVRNTRNVAHSRTGQPVHRLRRSPPDIRLIPQEENVESDDNKPAPRVLTSHQRS